MCAVQLRVSKIDLAGFLLLEGTEHFRVIHLDLKMEPKMLLFQPLLSSRLPVSNRRRIWIVVQKWYSSQFAVL